MNKNRMVWPALACALAGGFMWLGATGARADADDKPAAEESVVTEVPVHVGKIILATLHDYLVGYGMVEPEPAGNGHPAASAKLTSPTAGVVVEAPGMEGERVKKGDLLFRLDSRAADAAVEVAEKHLARQQQLITVEGTSKKVLLDAEQQLAIARVQQALLRVEAPVSGVLVHYNARAGEAVDTTTVLAEVIDLDRLVASMRIPTAEADRLNTNQPVEISVGRSKSSAAAASSNAVLGAVVYLSPQVDAATDTVLVRASIPSGSALRPGQFVAARVVCETRSHRLAVPVESVVTMDGASVIAVVEGDKAIQKPVKTGLREGGLVEVAGDGLKEGMTIVTVGAYALPRETKVRVLDK
jgi:membrane fusion protein (multidrug efflux system)